MFCLHLNSGFRKPIPRSRSYIDSSSRKLNHSTRTDSICGGALPMCPPHILYLHRSSSPSYNCATMSSTVASRSRALKTELQQQACQNIPQPSILLERRYAHTSTSPRAHSPLQCPLFDDPYLNPNTEPRFSLPTAHIQTNGSASNHRNVSPPRVHRTRLIQYQ